MIERLRAWRETMDNRWKEWVLGYNRNAQFDLLKKVGISTPDTDDLGRLLMIVISAAAAVRRRRGLVGLAPPHARPAPDAAARVGVARAAGRTACRWRRTSRPACVAAALRRRFGAPADGLARRLDAMERLRYGPRRPDAAAPDWRGVRGGARALAAALAQAARARDAAPAHAGA